MTQSSWERAKLLLADAAALPSSDRERYVVEHCPDPELQREVLEWLASPAALTGIMSVSALAPGARLGPYVIDRLIGRGGMGEVYKATDSSLNRSVAIKVLPAVFDGDADRQARLRREARLLAALNHPNIAHIHGFEESSGVAALVMEFVDGPTLADHLQRPMPLGEVLTTARQVADALEAAHAQGIIHRDLKPANIKVREDGTVKVLDFGLARSAASNVARESSVVSRSATQPGLVVGTPAYMAPEQALGKPVDKRADLWSFGCVLYEMLSGKRAFPGADISDTLSRVVGSDPDWTALPTQTPASVRRLLRRCLEKPVNKRLADIADARLEIEEALSPSGPSAAARPASMAVTGWSRAWPWAVAAACLALTTVLTLGWLWPKIPPAHPMDLSVNLGVRGESVKPVMSYVAISPDGTNVAFAASKWFEDTSRLYVRNFDRRDAILLPGTDGALNPFFSPDGRWIGFFAEGKLKTIAVTGGAPITLCDAPDGRGGTWGEDDTIIFSAGPQTALSRVSAAGGTPEALTPLEKDEKTQRWPQILPGGKAVLYTSLSPSGKEFNFREATLFVQALPTGGRKILKRGATYGRYAASGHLLYLSNNKLFTAPFDLKRLEITGPERQVTDDRLISNPTAGSAMFAMSASGTLVYVRQFMTADVRPISWLDRSGGTSMLRATPTAWTEFSFTPDGKKLAVTSLDGKQADVWIEDFTRPDALERLTNFNSGSGVPVWTPDGRRVVFASMLGEKEVGPTYNLYWLSVDGLGALQRLTTSPNLQKPGSWHPEKHVLAFTEYRPRATVMLLSVEGDDRSGWKPANPTAFFDEEFDQREPAFSPKGEWLAYESNRSGEYNIYVRPFPGPGPATQISTTGGLLPSWSRTRSELIYEGLDQRVMIASYSVKDGAFHVDRIRLWPEAWVTAQRGHVTGFALHPDGERLVLPAVGAGPSPKWQWFELRLNFFDELRRIAPPEAR